MNGINFVINVHELAIGYPIVLHAIVRRKFVYFNAYGITHTHMAKYKISDVIDDKITPKEAFKEIEETYCREVKNVPKSKC